jgi:ribosomal protein L19
MPSTLEDFANVTEEQSRVLFLELKPGDRIELLHNVKVGMKTWTTITEGTVVRVERRRHGLHHRRNVDDKVFSDLIVLRHDSGELTTVTMDEFTRIRRVLP